MSTSRRSAVVGSSTWWAWFLSSKIWMGCVSKRVARHAAIARCPCTAACISRSTGSVILVKAVASMTNSNGFIDEHGCVKRNKRKAARKVIFGRADSRRCLRRFPVRSLSGFATSSCPRDRSPIAPSQLKAGKGCRRMICAQVTIVTFNHGDAGPTQLRHDQQVESVRNQSRDDAVSQRVCRGARREFCCSSSDFYRAFPHVLVPGHAIASAKQRICWQPAFATL